MYSSPVNKSDGNSQLDATTELSNILGYTHLWTQITPTNLKW